MKEETIDYKALNYRKRSAKIDQHTVAYYNLGNSYSRLLMYDEATGSVFTRTIEKTYGRTLMVHLMNSLSWTRATLRRTMSIVAS